MQRKRALIIAGGLALAAFLIAFFSLSAAKQTQAVVVVTEFVPSGTRLRANQLAVQEIAEELVPPQAYTDKESLVGQTLRVPRAAGDCLTPAFFQSTALPLTDPHQRLVFLELTPAEAGAGVLAPGMYVDLIIGFDAPLVQTLLREQEEGEARVAEGIPLTPTPTPVPLGVIPAASPTPLPPSPWQTAARVAVTNLRIAFVSPALQLAATQAQAVGEEEESGLTTVRTSSQAGLVGFEVPAAAVELSDGYRVSLPALLNLAAREGSVQLSIRPRQAVEAEELPSVRLVELLHHVAGYAPTPVSPAATSTLLWPDETVTQAPPITTTATDSITATDTLTTTKKGGSDE
ncbi:MAG: SAF domain-containing protein [Chloroflexota bacterium]|nr:SAF domain-containing protein [Chloroflexota bacterium]